MTLNEKVSKLAQELSSGRVSAHIRIDGCVPVTAIGRISVRTKSSSHTAKFRALSDLIVHAYERGLFVVEVVDDGKDGFSLDLIESVA